MRLQLKVVGHCIAEYIRCSYAFDIITIARHFTCFTVMTISSDLWRKCPYKFHQYCLGHIKI